MLAKAHPHYQVIRQTFVGDVIPELDVLVAVGQVGGRNLVLILIVISCKT